MGLHYKITITIITITSHPWFIFQLLMNYTLKKYAQILHYGTNIFLW